MPLRAIDILSRSSLHTRPFSNNNNPSSPSSSKKRAPWCNFKLDSLSCVLAYIFIVAVLVFVLVVAFVGLSRVNRLADHLGFDFDNETDTSREDGDAKEHSANSITIRLNGASESFTVPTHTPLSSSMRSFQIGEEYRVVDGRARLVQGQVHLFYAKGAEKDEEGDDAELFTQNAILGDCFVINSMGTRWKTPMPYHIYPNNSQGIDEQYVINSMRAAFDTWNEQLQKPAFGQYLPSLPSAYNVHYQDGYNTFHFGNILKPGVIAVTFTWGIFDGPFSERKLLEWDMIFDQEDYKWCDADEDMFCMDLQNIGTHEAGHAGGKGDVPDPECSNVTMYAYASAGETKKRTLAPEDVYGWRLLYEEEEPPDPRLRSSSSQRNFSTLLFFLALVFLFS